VNRRVVFFLVAAVICLALVPVVDTKFRWVPEGVGGIYLVLTALAALDAFGRRNL
jgi:xanthine/uracil permease